LLDFLGLLKLEELWWVVFLRIGCVTGIRIGWWRVVEATIACIQCQIYKKMRRSGKSPTWHTAKIWDITLKIKLRSVHIN